MADETKIPAKFKEIVEKVESLSVLELSELVKVLEERFGVFPMPFGVGTPTPDASDRDVGTAGTQEESALKAVYLKAVGDQKIQVIKVVREVSGLGLKEAKDLVDAAPKMVKDELKPEEAEDLKKKLEAAGATVEVK